MLPSMTS